jgi:ribosome-associated protein
MRKKKDNENIKTEILLYNIIEGIRKVKGKEIVDIDLSMLEQRVCQHFLICHGDSNTHVNAIADSVEREMKEKLSWPAYHKEGQENASWVLLDYGNIVVHVFQKEYRDFYQLEELWADGNINKIE